MLAAFLSGAKDLQVREAEIPQIGEHDILLEVKRAAICGTDVRMYKNGYAGISKETPKILGHELAGVIKEVGSKVTEYEAGTRVTVAPNMGCGLCRQCVSGNNHLCKDYQALGINIDGGFAEYVKVPEAAVRQGNITPIEDHVSFEEAALIEPLACVYNGFQKVDIKAGDSVVVIGAGPIGIMHTQLAIMAGASRVILCNRSEDRLTLAKQMEPRLETVTANRLQQYIMDTTNGEGVDVAITAAPSPESQTLAIDLMAINGRVNFFGGLPKDREMVPLNANTIHYKQLIVTGTTRSSVLQFRQSLDFVTRGIVELKPLITARYPLAEMEQAFNNAIEAQGLKNIITMD